MCLVGRDIPKLGAKNELEKNGRFPNFFFFFGRPFSFFLFHGHIAHALPMNRPTFFFPAHVLHFFLMGVFWSGVGAYGDWSD